MPGRRVPGHAHTIDERGVHCTCGWSSDVATKRARRSAYAEHLDTARTERLSTCRDCKEVKDAKLMSTAKPGLCKQCSSARTRAWAQANPEEWERHRRRSWLKRKYGITPEEYDERLAAQGGVCAICGEPPEDPRGYRMHVDHDHATGAVRGILCGSCNRGLGNFGDDIDRLLAAVEYLRS